MTVRDRTGTVKRPVKEPKGFRRVIPDPRETMTVSFEITPDRPAFHDIRS
jgi:hypothetical protein